MNRDDRIASGSPRVVITGVGMVTPWGLRDDTWHAMQNRTGDAPGYRHLDARVGGYALPPPFDTAPSRAESAGLAAAEEAWRDAGSFPVSSRTGLVFGASKGDAWSWHHQALQHSTGNHQRPQTAATYDGAIWPHHLSSRLINAFHLTGPATCPVAACATGLVAVIRGYQWILSGMCDQVLAGATDASLTPAVAHSFRRLGVLARGEGDQSPRCRPFDARRNGFVIGEGGAALLLERRDLAIARGATPYAEIVGGAELTDPTGLLAVEPHGLAIEALLRATMTQAHWSPSEIDGVGLHGTGTPLNDRAEATALHRLFGATTLPFGLAFKHQLGHLLGAAGGVELALTALLLKHQIAPSFPPDFQPDRDAPLRIPGVTALAHTDPPATWNRLLKISLGFGGHLAGLAIQRV